MVQFHDSLHNQYKGVVLFFFCRHDFDPRIKKIIRKPQGGLNVRFCRAGCHWQLHARRLAFPCNTHQASRSKQSAQRRRRWQAAFEVLRRGRVVVCTPDPGRVWRAGTQGLRWFLGRREPIPEYADRNTALTRLYLLRVAHGCDASHHVVAHRHALKRIDHVEPSANGDKLIALQGAPGRAHSKFVDVQTLDALRTSVAQSSQAFMALPLPQAPVHPHSPQAPELAPPPTPEAAIAPAMSR